MMSIGSDWVVVCGEAIAQYDRDRVATALAEGGRRVSQVTLEQVPTHASHLTPHNSHLTPHTPHLTPLAPHNEICRNTWFQCLCKSTCKAGTTAGWVDQKSWRILSVRDGSDAPCAGQVISSIPKSIPKLSPTPRTSSVSQVNCCNCGAATPTIEVASCNNHHSYCEDCFSTVVRSQVVGEDRSRFLARNCKVVCAYCTLSPSSAANAEFDMRLCGSKLQADMYNRYLSCLSEIAVIQTQQEYEKRMEQMRKERTQSLIAADPDAHQISK